jgi:hypothetical protein
MRQIAFILGSPPAVINRNACRLLKTARRITDSTPTFLQLI